MTLKYAVPLSGSIEDNLCKVSYWWRGVSLLGPTFDQFSDWFASSCTKVVEDGMRTRF